MNLNKYGALKIARAMAGDVGLGCVFEEDSQPRTDGHNIYVQQPNERWSKSEWVHWWSSFYHEVGHNDPDMKDCFELIKKKRIDMSSFFGVGINILDDNRQEHHRFGELRGRSHYLEEGHKQALESILMSGKVGKDNDKHRKAIETLMAFDTWERSEWMVSMGNMYQDFLPLFDNEQLQWLDKLTNGSYVLKDNNTAEDEYELWKRIINEVFQFDAEQEEKQAQQAKRGSQQSGDGSEGSEDSAEGQGDGQSTESGEGKGESKGGTVKYEDLLKHSHAIMDGGSGSSGYKEPLNIEYGDPTFGGFISKDVTVLDYTNVVPEPRFSSYTKNIEIGGGKGLTNTVRRLLQIRSKSKSVYGQKSGKINGRSLYRLGMKEAHGFNERVFKKRTINDCLDVSVTILGDHSGSMGGDKYLHMANSCIMLHEVLTLLQVPFELLGFSEDHSGTTIMQYKTFASRTNPIKLKDAYCCATDYMNCNADGEAILWAYERLTRQKSKRKILIVLSDGQPSSVNGDADAHTREVIKQIEGDNVVEIYGLGIMNNNVQRLYKHNQVINEASELEPALLNLIKTKIIGE